MEDIELPILLRAQVAAYITLPRYECTMNGALGPNVGIFSLARKIDPRLFKLDDGEKALFDRTLKMLKLEATTRYLHHSIVESSKNRASDSQDIGREWPALMLLGSGSLEALPVID